MFRIRIRIIGPDPDPLQEMLIWIRVPKKNRDKLAYKSTKIIKIYFLKEITYFVSYTRIISSKLHQQKTSLQVLNLIQKTLRRKKLEFVAEPDPDPSSRKRIRIRINMIRIRNTDMNFKHKNKSYMHL